VTIVFDGDLEVFGGMSSSGAKVIFSQGESADDKIKKIVTQAQNTKSIVVVSDDRDIQYAVRALGATASGVREFLGQAKLPKREKGAGQIKKDSRKSGSPEAAKYIPKSDESKITSEFEKIWLKPDEE